MKTFATIILSLYLFSTFASGQSSDKSTNKEIGSSFPKVAAQSCDSVQLTPIRCMSSLPPVLPAFHLADSLSQQNQQLPRQIVSRAPFFINEQFSVALGKTYSDFKYENVTSFGTSFLIRPMEKLTIAITPVISHYFTGSRQYPSFTDFSGCFTAQYDITDKMAVKAFGQLSTSANKFYGYTPFVPQNAYGVGFKYKANKNLSFEVDVEQSKNNGMWYNEHNGMQTTY